MNRTEKNVEKFKAIELIKTFSGVEMKRFGRFLQSPYHNTNEDLVQLFDFLRSLYPTFDAAKLTRPKIWKKLYKSIPFQPIKFKKLFSELNLLAEDFIIIEQTRSDKSLQQKRLIAALEPRQFKRFVKESQNRIEAIEAKGEYQSQTDFLELHLLNQDLWYHAEWERHQVSQRELMAAHETLVSYMAFNKVRTVAEIETRRKFLNLVDFEYPITLANIKGKPLIHQNKPLYLYYQFYEFEKQPSWEFYELLKRELVENHSSYKLEFLQNGIIHLNNFLLGQIIKGEQKANQESFNLMKWAAEHQIFITNDRITETIFSNIAIVGIKNRKFSWTENYLKNNEKYLKTKNKDLVIGYLKASTAYASKKFETVIVELTTLQPSYQIQYYFFFKSVITRSYFELVLQGRIDYLESLYMELDAFEKGIRRNRKFSIVRKEGYLNYVKVLKQLSALFAVKENQDFKLVSLKSKVETFNLINKKDWLLEKIENLQKRAATGT